MKATDDRRTTEEIASEVERAAYVDGAMHGRAGHRCDPKVYGCESPFRRAWRDGWKDGAKFRTNTKERE